MGIGIVLWVLADARALGVAVAVAGLAVGVRTARRLLSERAVKRDAATIAAGLLSAADRVERDAVARAEAGEPEPARAALELAAERLRTLAPSAGRPEEVMDRARSLRAAAERL